MTQSGQIPLGAVVLAGGRSSRMGQDKALVPFCGRRMIDHVVEVLQELTDRVVVVAREAALIGDLSARVEEDERPYEGPLQALIAGLRAADAETSIVVGCDMPLLNPSLLAAIAKLREEGTDAVVPLSAHGPEPLHAAYGRCAIEPLLATLAGGERSLTGALERIAVRWMPEEEWRPLDPEGRSFTSVNTPEELAAAAAIREGR